MEKRVLDTSILLSYWRKCATDSLTTMNEADVRTWAKTLIRFYESNAIVTPVYIEVVAGVTSAHEMSLTRAYLEQFRVIDGGKILNEDWKEAKRIAERIPRTGHRRQLGDCLIRAISTRLGYEITTKDKVFPRRPQSRKGKK